MPGSGAAAPSRCLPPRPPGYDLGLMISGARPCAVLVWCLSATVATAAITLVSVQQEVEIGKQANAQVRRDVPELRDADVNTYVRELGRRLIARADGPK